MSRQPNFLIIGAARSGTTALASFLGQHPQVFLTDPKEPHFLAFNGSNLSFSGPGDDTTINRVSVTNQHEYERLFARCNGALAVGEGSVSTMYYPQASIPNIRAFATEAKLIAILRNPIERAFSSYMYMTARGFEPIQDFMESLMQEERRIQDGWHHIWHYTKMGFYTDQIRAFREAFGSDRLKLILHEDLKHSPETLFRDLFDFLGVRQDFVPQTRAEINRAGKPKNETLQFLMKLLGKNSVLKGLVRSLVPSSAREKIRSSNLAHPDMSVEAREYLEDLFADEISSLEQETGRDLSAWLAKGRYRLHNSIEQVKSTR